MNSWWRCRCMLRAMTMPSRTLSAAKSCGALLLVVVLHGAQPSPLHGQDRQGPVQCLGLRYFINRLHDGVGGRIDVKPDDITQLSTNVRSLESLNCRQRG